MVAISQTGSVRDFPAYLHFTPRPDQPERFDEQTAFYESKGDGVGWMIGGNGAGCLAAEQTIYDPIEGRDRVVCEIGSGFHVIARNTDGNAVVAKAEQPRTYGTEDLYAITLSNGQIFRATLGHRLLTAQGWREIGDILKSDSHAEKTLASIPGTHEIHIESATFLRRDVYWDFHVPEYENYWMAGVWNHNTTTTLLAKVARFIYETPPPRPDTPFWVIAKSYDQVTKTCWKEKLYGQGHILDKDVDWPRVGWYKSKQRLPYSVPLKPDAKGNNWMLEFRSYEQGIGAMMAQAIGGFAFVEQFPWGVFEEVLRGCREYNFPGSKLVEYTPVDPDLSIDIEEMIENGYEPETGRQPGLRYLPKNWKIYHANTMCAMEAGHVDAKWFEEFFGMVPEDMRDVRMLGMFASFEGVIYKEFNTATHCMGDEIWSRLKGCTHFRGIDWGAGPENDFTCTWAARNGLGQWFIYDEYCSNDQTKTTVDHLSQVYEQWGWPDTSAYGPSFCDPSSPDNIRIANKLSVYNPAVENLHMMRGKNSVIEGIEHVQYLLKPQIPVPMVDEKGMPIIDSETGKVKIRMEPKLFIHRYNCPKLVQQMKTYRWMRGADPKAKAGRNPKDAPRSPLKKNDHQVDGMRYALFSADSMLNSTISSAKSHSEITAQTSGEYLPERGLRGFTTQHKSNRKGGR